MSKIVIISMFPEDEVPYSKLYTDVLEENGKEYDILYWNRENDGPPIYKKNKITYNLFCPMGGKKYKKIYKMLKYANFIRKVLNDKNYDKAIILTTVPGIFSWDILLKKYKNKFIFDIRDYTNEHSKLYYLVEKKIIKASYKTMISSEGFKKFLPEHDYQLVHNISNEDKMCDEVKEINNNDIVIGFVGNVRYKKENLELIKQLSEKKQYTIAYWGKVVFGNEFVTDTSNVNFFGPYKNNEKNNIYNNITFINAIYGTDGLEVTTAVPNRYYDAILFKKPIITSKGTYLGELVEKNNLGISVDVFSDNIDEKIKEYIAGFNDEEFSRSCNQLWDEYSQDQFLFKNYIENFLLSDINRRKN